MRCARRTRGEDRADRGEGVVRLPIRGRHDAENGRSGRLLAPLVRGFHNPKGSAQALASTVNIFRQPCLYCDRACPSISRSSSISTRSLVIVTRVIYFFRRRFALATARLRQGASIEAIDTLEPAEISLRPDVAAATAFSRTMRWYSAGEHLFCMTSSVRRAIVSQDAMIRSVIIIGSDTVLRRLRAVMDNPFPMTRRYNAFKVLTFPGVGVAFLHAVTAPERLLPRHRQSLRSLLLDRWRFGRSAFGDGTGWRTSAAGLSSRNTS